MRELENMAVTQELLLYFNRRTIGWEGESMVKGVELLLIVDPCRNYTRSAVALDLPVLIFFMILFLII